MSVASSIEERIVQMKFDNKQFEQGAKESLSTLDKLDNVLDQLGEGGGIEHLESSLDFLEKRFSSIGIAGMAAISKITNSVMDLAGKLLTAIPKQIASGGWTRAANIEQARFQLKGLGVDWNDVSDDIDLAVKGTAYGMDEAAVAASQFAATFKSQPGFWQDATESMNGYDKQVSKMAISLRAISGVAGMTNTSYSEIADIFTSVSGTGKLMTQDLRRLEGRGLNAAATMGEVLGKTENEVREMVTKGKVDFYTFASAMDYAFGQHAKDANETFNGSLANMKAALSRIGADFATPIRNAGIVVFNAFRQAFDRARKITQPFAEGEFTKKLEPVAQAISRFAESLNFDWLKGAMYALKNFDTSGIENAINKITELNNKIHELFNPVKEIVEEVTTIKSVEAPMETVTEEMKNTFQEVQKLKSMGYTDGGIAQALGITKQQAHEYMDPDFLDVSDPVERTFKEVQRLKQGGYTEGGIMQALGLTKEQAQKYLDPGYLDKYVKEQQEKAEEVVTSTTTKTIPNDPAVARIQNLKAAFDGLKVVFDNARDALSIFNETLFSGVGGTILSAFDSLLEKVGKVGAKLQTFKDFFGQHHGSNILPGFNKDAEERVQRIRDLAEKVRALMNPVSRIIRASWDIVKSVSTSVFSLLKSQTPIASSLFGTVYNILLKVITKVADFSETLRDLIKNNSVFETIFGGIGAAISTVFSGFTTVTSAVGDFLKSLLKLKEGQTVVERIVELLSGAGSKVANVFKNAGSIIGKALGDKSLISDTTKLSGTLIGALIAWRKIESTKWKVGRLGRMFKMLKEGVGKFFTSAENWANIPDRISTVLSRTSGAIRAFGDNLNAKSIFIIAGAVGALALSLAVLASIDITGLMNGLGAVTVLMGELVLAFLAIHAIMNYKNYSNQANGTLNVFEKLFGKMGVLTGQFGKKMDVFGGKMKMFGGALGAAFKNIANAAMRYIESKTILNIAKAMVALGLSVLALAAAVWVLSKVDPNTLWNSVFAVMALLAALAGVLWLLSKKASTMAMPMIAVAFVSIGVAVILLTAALLALSKVPVTSLLKSLGAVSAMLFVITGMLKWISSGELKNGGDMLAAAVSILMMAAALTMLAVPLLVLSYIPWQNIAVGLGAMLAMLVMLTAVLRIMSGVAFYPANMIAAAFAMILISTAIMIMVAALAALTVIWAVFPWQQIVAGGVALIVMVILISAVLAVLAPISIGMIAVAGAFLIFGLALLAIGAAVAVASAGLVELAAAINMLTGVDYKQFKEIGRGLREIGRGMKHLGIGGVIMSLGIDAFAALVPLASSLAVMNDMDMFKLGPGMAKVGAGLKKIGIGGAYLLLGSAGLIAGVPALTALATAMPSLVEGFQSFESLNTATITTAAIALSEACMTLFGLEFATIHDGTDALKNLAAAMPELESGFNSMASIDAETLKTSSDALSQCIKTLFGVEFATLIKDGTPALKNLGTAMPEIANGMNALSGLDAAAMETSTEALKKCIRVLFGSQFASFSDGSQQLKTLGEAMPGIAEGMNALSTIDGAAMSTSVGAMKDSIKALFELQFSNFAQNAESLSVIGDSLLSFGKGIQSLSGLDFAIAATAFAFIQDNYSGISGLEVGTLSTVADETVSFADALASLISSCAGLAQVAADISALAESISQAASAINEVPDNAGGKLSGLSGIKLGGAGGSGIDYTQFLGDISSGSEGAVDINDLVGGEINVADYINTDGQTTDRTLITKMFMGDAASTSVTVDTSSVAAAQEELNSFDPSAFIANLQETNNISSETTAVLTDLFSSIGNADPQAIQEYMSAFDFTSMTDSEIRSWAENAKIDIGSMIDTSSVQTAATEVQAAAAEIPAGVQQGIESNKAVAENAAGNMGTGILGFFKTMLGIASPSTVFAEAGREIPAGVEQGINENSDVAVAAVETMATSLTEAFSNLSIGGEGIDTSGIGVMVEGLTTSLTSSVPQVQVSAQNLGQAIANGITSKQPNINAAVISAVQSANQSAVALGAHFAQGFANGIYSRIGAVSQAATRMAQSAEREIRVVIEAHSPSRVTTRLGGYFGQGFANGITGQISNVVSASGELAHSATDAISTVGDGMQSAMAQAMSMVAAIVNSDMDINPTITPVVDLSNIDKASSYVSGTFGRSYSYNSVPARTSSIMSSLQSTRNGIPSSSNTNNSNVTNLYIDGIKYNTDDYVDSSIRNFIETMTRKQKMYA